MKPQRLGLFVSIVFPALASAGVMNLFSGFSVEREVVLDTPKHPGAGRLAKAADGGYFVLGEADRGWIGKTDINGKLLWTYENPQRGKVFSRFEDAAPADDGGVLVCGWRERRDGATTQQAGLAIRLDRAGREVYRFEPSLEDSQRRLFQFKSCEQSGDGFVVLGTAVLGDSPATARGVYRLVLLRQDGGPTWQKDFDFGRGASGAGHIQVVSNGTIIFQSGGDIAHVDASGNLLEQVRLKEHDQPGSGCVLLRVPKPTDVLRLICEFYSHAKAKGQVVTLNQSLQQVSKAGYASPDMTSLNQGYALADSSVILFGARKSLLSSYQPAVISLHADGSLATYQFDGFGDKGWIADGLPTDVPGEFVTVRSVGETARKTVLTFLRGK